MSFAITPCFVASLQLGRAAGLGAEQLAVRPGDSQEYLVTHRDRLEFALPDGLPGRQVGENPWPMFSARNTPGMLTVPAATALAPAPI